MHKKKGDTLIEVALAIGIFSLVAIVVVSVISASTSAAQSALELTITREELDSQAEALRFIHDSYVSGSQSKDTSENAYAKLWKTITDLAKDNKESDENVVKYTPKYCSELYDDNGFMKDRTTRRQFIIDTRQLGYLKNESGDDNSSNIVVTPKTTDSTGLFYSATTYPRIVYKSATNKVTDEDFYSQTEDTNSKIERVEGIFIVAVEGKSSQIFNASRNKMETGKVSYYDFYIRSCWMPPGSDRASTISTVVRLYDPAAITY